MIQQQFSSTFTSKDFISFSLVLLPELPLRSASGAGLLLSLFGVTECPEQGVGDNCVTGREAEEHSTHFSRAQQDFHPRSQVTESCECQQTARKSQRFLDWCTWWPEHLSSYLFTGRKVIISVRLSIVSVRGWNKDMLCVSASFQGRAVVLGS